jgi:uncharacterized membrane protein
MTSSWKGFVRGALAGAAGTTALNVATGIDMAVRGRPASDAPQRVVSALVDQAGVSVPGDRRARDRRLAALGPLTGTAVGVAIGGVAGVLRAGGLWLPAAVGGPLLGAAAMLGSDGPIAALGVGNPRRWTAAEWAADAIPHLIYGLTTHAAVVTAIPERDAAERRPPMGSLVRAAALGAATGSRSSAGIAALSFTSRPADGGAIVSRWGSRPGSVVAGVLASGEVLLDKSAVVPPRTSSPGLLPRAALGATAASAVARREGHDGTLAGAIGLAAAVGASILGVQARAAAARRLGSDLPGALAEDVAAALLAWAGTRRRPSGQADRSISPSPIAVAG